MTLIIMISMAAISFPFIALELRRVIYNIRSSREDLERELERSRLEYEKKSAEHQRCREAIARAERDYAFHVANKYRLSPHLAYKMLSDGIKDKEPNMNFYN